MASEAPGPLRRRIAGLGAGGHARVLLEALAATGGYEVVELLDPRRAGETVAGIHVTGGDGRLGEIASSLDGVFVGVGGVSDTEPRRNCYEAARRLGLPVITIIHPSAVVSPSASVGAGAQVLAGAVVGTGVTIGENAIVNTGAVIDHDCIIGAHVHIATGARLSGGIRVGEGAHVGTGASVRQGVTIGPGAVVGAGAAVIGDVFAGDRVGGVPATSIPRREAIR